MSGGLAILLLVAASGCTAGAEAPSTPSPFADCAALTAAGSAPTSPVDLPDLRLPCFTGGAEVALRDVRRPALINLWGSYCDPCRRELPVMQRLADVAGDRITVLGVNTFDGREAGASFAEAVGVTMPTLFDPDRRLSDALGGTAMPLTVVVDASGRSRVHRLPLDAPGLADLVRSHTGVRVTL